MLFYILIDITLFVAKLLKYLDKVILGNKN